MPSSIRTFDLDGAGASRKTPFWAGRYALAPGVDTGRLAASRLLGARGRCPINSGAYPPGHLDTRCSLYPQSRVLGAAGTSEANAAWTGTTWWIPVAVSEQMMTMDSGAHSLL